MSDLAPVFSSPGEYADYSRELHKYSDADLSAEAQHHTLGTGPTQAAAGSHLHSGVYATFSHQHTYDDLPELVLNETEVILSDVDPTIANPALAEGTIWLNPNEVDADIEVVEGLGDGSLGAYTVSSTSFADHPSTWGKITYTPPVDGVMMVVASWAVDPTLLTGGAGTSKIQNTLRIMDASRAAVGSATGQTNTEYAGIEYFNATVVGKVLAGNTYWVELRHRRGPSTSGSYTLSDFDINIVFFPSGQFTSLTYVGP